MGDGAPTGRRTLDRCSGSGVPPEHGPLSSTARGAAEVRRRRFGLGRWRPPPTGILGSSTDRPSRIMHRPHITGIAWIRGLPLLALLLGACSSPVGVIRSGFEPVFADQSRNVLTAGVISASSLQALA